MGLPLWNIEWLNRCSQTSYPLTDWCSKQDQTATIAVPDSFLVGLHFSVHAGLNVSPERFFLFSLGIFGTGYSLGLGYYTEDNKRLLVASVNIAKGLHEENQSYALLGLGDYDDSVGRVVIGKLDEIEQLPTGLYQFDYDDASIEVDCIRPMIRGITSITVVNGQDRSPPLYGHIELTAGTNFRLRYSGGTIPEIIFDAISGEGLNETCVCEEEDDGPCISKINGIPPYPDGNFKLVGDNCLELEPIDYGLKIVDRCSSPCCDCQELDALTQQIERFADGVMTLQNFSSRLGAEVTNMNSVILASKLSASSCLTC